MLPRNPEGPGSRANPFEVPDKTPPKKKEENPSLERPQLGDVDPPKRVGILVVVEILLWRCGYSFFYSSVGPLDPAHSSRKQRALDALASRGIYLCPPSGGELGPPTGILGPAFHPNTTANSNTTENSTRSSTLSSASSSRSSSTNSSTSSVNSSAHPWINFGDDLRSRLARLETEPFLGLQSIPSQPVRRYLPPPTPAPAPTSSTPTASTSAHTSVTFTASLDARTLINGPLPPPNDPRGWRLTRSEPLVHNDLWLGGIGGPSDQLPVKSHHKCGICHMVKSHPVSYVCGHGHCYVCIRLWLERKWTCPECVTPMYHAPFRIFFEDTTLAMEYPEWKDRSVVDFSFEGLRFPEEPQGVVLAPATP
ncbi:hypothetical protein C8R43DRAFT_1135847 [Mycena crocata]|nr:hypothetical protein C8R43DRAFT_1135847 [Mycena crocata]